MRQFELIKEDAAYMFNEFRESVRNGVRQRPPLRSLVLKFYQATMTPAQKRVYEEIKKTQKPVDAKGSQLTVTSIVSAKGIAKALTVLELEQPIGKDDIMVTYSGNSECFKVISIMRKHWF